MAKSKVSSEFEMFDAKNRSKFEAAKTAEKQSRGNPMPVGTVGTAIISDYTAARAKTGKKYPYVAVEVTVIEPEEYKGQKVTGSYHQIFDSEGMTASDRMSMLLDNLEDMGLSRETRETHEKLAECLDELINEPHYVTFTVKLGYNGRKDMECFAMKSEDAPNETQNSEAAPNVCMYMNAKHDVIARDGDKLTIKNRASGKTRTVDIDEVEMAD